ncbi:MAG: hypothetical protein IT438_11565 [Phycisphaerales bacterium]|nr:hypothetical protein [Phycisphaerales bacterium]
MRHARNLALEPACTVLAAIALALPACVGYNSYNAPNAGADMTVKHGFTNPNDDPFPPLMTESVRWVITRYPAVTNAEWAPPLGVPPEGSEFAVNLPVGTNNLVYKRTVERIGYGAVPMEPGRESLPTYHISRLWVNGDEAKVDIVRPVPGMVSADGHQATQGITVRLRGGLQPWHVTSHRVWEMNAMPIPPLNYVPEMGAKVPTATAAVGADGSAELINLPDAQAK